MSGSSMARPLKRAPRSARTRAAAACTCVFDLLTIIALLVLLPILAVIFSLVCVVPSLAYLFSKLRCAKRDYMDSTSAWVSLMEASIDAVFVSKAKVSAEHLFQKFTEVYLESDVPQFKRFRQRAVRPCFTWHYWEDVRETWTPRDNMFVIKEPVTQKELECRVAEFQSTVWDDRYPCWQLHHFERYIDDAGRETSATIFRLHHCIGDGFACMRLLMRATDPRKPPSESSPDRNSNGTANGTANGDANGSPNGSGSGERRRKLGKCEALRHSLRVLRKTLLLLPDRASAFKASRFMATADPKAVTWTTCSMSVKELKEVGKLLCGVTINDLLLALMARAYRRHALTVPTPPARDLTAVMWVALAPLKHIYSDFTERPFKWGNSTLGVVTLPFAVGSDSFDEPLDGTVDGVHEATSDPALPLEALLNNLFLSAIGCVPGLLGYPLAKVLCSKASVSMSNLPGPQYEMNWIGSPLQGMSFFVPPSMTVSNLVTIMTYDDKICVGLSSDKSVLDQEALDRIAKEHLQAEFDLLKKIVGEVATW